MQVPIERDILLSVCMVTYNHEKWIGQAIEGVLDAENFIFYRINNWRGLFDR